MSQLKSVFGRSPRNQRNRLAGLSCIAIVASCLAASATTARAFCEDRDDGSRCHPQIVRAGLGFLRPYVLKQIADEVNGPDQVSFIDYASDDHFDACNFDGGTDRINDRYFDYSTGFTVLDALSPKRRMMTHPGLQIPSYVDYPKVFDGMKKWAWLLHATHDFYAHSNWVEMGFTDPEQDLIDRRLGPWRELPSSWGTVRAGVLTSQADMPDGWKLSFPIPDPIAADLDNKELAAQSLTRRIPVITKPDGSKYRVLITGLASHTIPSQDCPDGMKIPHETLNKDNISRRWHKEAAQMAVGQTRHEWCRLLSLSATRTGPDASGVLMGLLVRSDGDPHPKGTACARGKPGPIEVTVTATRIAVRDDHEDDGPGQLNFVLTAFSKDLRQSARSQSRTVDVNSGDLVAKPSLPDRIRLCMDPTDQLFVSLQAWEDDGTSARGDLSSEDDILSGVTTSALGVGALAAGSSRMSISRASDNQHRKDLEATFEVIAKPLAGCHEIRDHREEPDGQRPTPLR